MPRPVSWLTGRRDRPCLPGRAGRPVAPRPGPAAAERDENSPITVARAAPASHRLPEHHGAATV